MVFFTEAQKRFRHRVREFARNELAQEARERAQFDHTTIEVIQKLSDAGFLGLTTSVEYGGSPTDCVSMGIAFEEICGVDFSPFSLMLSHVVIPLMMEWACEDLREEWLPALCQGKKLACFGNTEPNCGSDAAAITTRATREGDGYVINGEKTSISGGMQADVILLTAKTNPDAGARGVSCFFVPLNTPGVDRSRFIDMGVHPSGRASVFLNNVIVPAWFRIGEEGSGFTKIMNGFDFARVLVVLATLGMAEVTMAETVGYAKERTKYGHPIGSFEGVSFKLAENATFIEASRMLCYKALKLRDEGMPHSKESAMAKWYGAVCASRAIHDCLITHGFRGYSGAFPVEQRWRDAFGAQLGDGTAEIMKLIIAREMLGGKASPVI